MRDHIDAPVFCHGGNFLAGGDAADNAQVGPEVTDLSLVEQGLVFFNTHITFAGRDRDHAVGGNVLLDADIVQNRIFVEVAKVLVNALAQFNGFHGLEAAVSFERDVDVPAGDFADGFERFSVDADLLSAVLVGAIFGRGIDLADADVLPAFIPQGFYVVADVFRRLVIGGGVIDTNLVADRAAEQFIDRYAEGFTLKVPKRNVNRGDGGADDLAAEVAGPVQTLVNPFDLEGVFADDQLLKSRNSGNNGFLPSPAAVSPQPYSPFSVVTLT